MPRRFLPSRDTLYALAFLLPFLTVNLAFLIVPFARGLWISFHDWDLLGAAAGRAPHFIGLQNYSALLTDRLFWASLLHTAEFLVMAVPSITVAGLLLALALNRQLRSFALFRSVIFLSGAFSVSVLTLIWVMVLNPSRGLVGQGMQALGLTPFDILADRRFAMLALVITTLWWSAGFPMALFLAALQQIPSERYEAAQLDHAGVWTTFRRITLPAISRTVWLVVLIETLLHVQVFGQVLLMTKGGPANSTRVLVQYLYESGFRDWRLGYASAISLMLFGIMALISLLQFRLLRSGGEER
jgi:multiple sugar transport system permease protein